MCVFEKSSEPEAKSEGSFGGPVFEVHSYVDCI